MSELLSVETREKIHKLLDAVEVNDGDSASEIIRDLCSINKADVQEKEDLLYRKVGELTRGLHDSLKNFNDEQRFINFAGVDLPDARGRLRYVIEKTQQAADKTMDKIEQIVPIADQLKKDSSDLFQQWEKLGRKEMSGAEFREVFKTMFSYLKATQEQSEFIHANLSEILLAQDFQDLTGQVLNRVINLVTDLEDNLVRLIKFAGERSGDKVASETKLSLQPAVNTNSAEGPQINPKGRSDVVSGQDEVDDLLSSLGF